MQARQGGDRPRLEGVLSVESEVFLHHHLVGLWRTSLNPDAWPGFADC